jgi:hypothetical protein
LVWFGLVWQHDDLFKMYTHTLSISPPHTQPTTHRAEGGWPQVGGEGDVILLKGRLEELEKLKGEREAEAIASKKRAVELEAGACFGGFVLLLGVLGVGGGGKHGVVCRCAVLCVLCVLVSVLLVVDCRVRLLSRPPAEFRRLNVKKPKDRHARTQPSKCIHTPTHPPHSPVPACACTRHQVPPRAERGAGGRDHARAQGEGRHTGEERKSLWGWGWG